MATRVRSDDEQVGWNAGRKRQRRRAGLTCLVAVVVGGLLVLMSDRFLIAPLLPILTASLWLVATWTCDAVFRVRSALVRYPVARAELSWAVASNHELPPNWSEAPVRGTIHRTPRGWVWRASPLIAAELPVLRWSDTEVAVRTMTPVWGPLQPPIAQLRLYLRGGDTVEFVVWHADDLLEASLVGSALAS
jgi:hypothetical protein